MEAKLFNNHNAFLKYGFLENLETILEGLAVVQTAIYEYMLKEHVACEPDSGKFTDNDFARLAGMSAAVTQMLADDTVEQINRLDRLEGYLEMNKENNGGIKERKAA